MTTITELPGLEHLKEMFKDIEETVNTYSLADAIREGSSVTTKQTDGWYDVDANATCALSAALIAVKARGLA